MIRGHFTALAVGVMMAAGAALGNAFSAAAETHYRPHISIGAKAGATLSRMSFSPSVPQKMLQGMVGGVTFRYAEERHFGLIAELLIEQRGWQEDFETAAYTYKRRLTYLDLPLLTHIYFGGRRFKGFVNLGPEVGYMLSHSVDCDFDYFNPTGVPGLPTEHRMLDQMTQEVKNRMDYGITAGLGCEFYLTPRQSLVLEARYYFGIGNVFASGRRDPFSASRTSSILVTLGYNFRIR